MARESERVSENMRKKTVGALWIQEMEEAKRKYATNETQQMDATEVVIGPRSSVDLDAVRIMSMTRRRLLNVETNKVIKRVVLNIVLALTGRTTIHTTTHTTTTHALANALVATPNLVILDTLATLLILDTLVTVGIREILGIREIDICTRHSKKSMTERIIDSGTIIDRHFHTRQTC